jgi:hypothetical protein
MRLPGSRVSSRAEAPKFQCVNNFGERWHDPHYCR